VLTLEQQSSSVIHAIQHREATFMTTIISATFETLPKAQIAVHHLHGRGCEDDDIHVFHNNAPGQHAAFPIGGDERVDPESHGGAGGALGGAAVGAGAGGIAGAIGGPLGAALGAGTGAFVGSLAGALKGLSSGKNEEPEERRPAGVVVAVHVAGCARETDIERILREDGAMLVEKLEGEWRGGEWQDFDPVAPPQRAEDAAPEILYRIAPGGHGRWNVFEGGAGKLLSDFTTRDEAINYATSLAAAKRRAVVEIYRAGGELESSRAFSGPGPLGPGGSA
jgi:hypothetical protein